MEYVERRYRSRMGRDAVVFTVSHRESDLWIAVDRGDAAVMAARTEHFLHELRVRLDRYLDCDPAYLRALVPCLPRPDAPPLLHEMAVAAATAGIGPMSAVAGAFARETGRMLRREFGVGEVVVENGGDIYADVHRPLDVALFAGESPLSERVGLHIPGGAFPLGICTSSGTVGPSLSFGRADAVMIVCRDVLLADSYGPTASAPRRIRAPSSNGPAACRRFWGRWPSRANGWPSAARSSCGCSEKPGIFKKSFRLTISRQTPPFRFPSVANYARKDDTLRSIRM